MLQTLLKIHSIQPHGMWLTMGRWPCCCRYLEITDDLSGIRHELGPRWTSGPIAPQVDFELLGTHVLCSQVAHHLSNKAYVTDVIWIPGSPSFTVQQKWSLGTRLQQWHKWLLSLFDRSFHLMTVVYLPTSVLSWLPGLLPGTQASSKTIPMSLIL